MRRARVHRVVEFGRYEGFGLPVSDGYTTKCGMKGGASLMALGVTDRGSGHFCNQCWPGSRPIRKQRDVPAGRF